MSYILNIETATKNCSVALAQNANLVVCKEVADMSYTHAEKLHVFIEEVIAEASITYADLAAIAVSRGPGSYTGLRIGVAAAKGLCFSLGIPLISIDTLKVLASQVSINDGYIVPMIDARRMEVYSAIFDSKRDYVREIEAEIIVESSFRNYNERLYFVGDCLAKCKPVLTANNRVFLDDIFYPSAKDMCALSFDKFQSNEFADSAYFEPFYLKDFLITPSKK